MKLKPQEIADALKAYARKVVLESFDPANPMSKPTKSQLEFLQDFGKFRQQWIVSGNQAGKTSTCVRNLTWAVEEKHPFWKRPAQWANDKLQALVVGQTGKIIEESLLPRIEAFLEPGTYKVVRVGNVAQRIEHLEDKWTIIFQSMENEQQARKRVQSYVLHFVWLDEMAQTTAFINELFMRLNSKSGYFMASFTPLVVNPQIKKMVDMAATPYAKKYVFLMFDNPVYRDSPEKQAEVLAQYASSSEAELRCRLYGEWMSAESAVWDINLDTMVEDPDDYGPHWRHIEAVDPAMKSALGLIVAAQDPETNVWYVVRAEYIKGYLDPNDLFEAVQERVRKTSPNVVRHVCDPHESWYLGIAAGHKTTPVNYMWPHDKNNRKAELIKNLQKALGDRVRIASWCKPVVEELTTAQYADGSSSEKIKIKNGSDYHLADALQYLVDCLPKNEVVKKFQTWQAQIREEHNARQAARYEQQVREKSGKSRRQFSKLRTTLRRRKIR